VKDLINVMFVENVSHSWQLSNDMNLPTVMRNHSHAMNVDGDSKELVISNNTERGTPGSEATNALSVGNVLNCCLIFSVINEYTGEV